MAYQLQDLEETSRGLENVGVEGETHAAVLERKSKKILGTIFPTTKNWFKTHPKQISMTKCQRGYLSLEHECCWHGWNVLAISIHELGLLVDCFENGDGSNSEQESYGARTNRQEPKEHQPLYLSHLSILFQFLGNSDTDVRFNLLQDFQKVLDLKRTDVVKHVNF